jgi:hypothetical protein
VARRTTDGPSRRRARPTDLMRAVIRLTDPRRCGVALRTPSAGPQRLCSPTVSVTNGGNPVRILTSSGTFSDWILRLGRAKRKVAASSAIHRLACPSGRAGSRRSPRGRPQPVSFGIDHRTLPSGGRNCAERRPGRRISEGLTGGVSVWPPLQMVSRQSRFRLDPGPRRTELDGMAQKPRAARTPIAPRR